MTPTVQYAEQRVERRGVSYTFLDEMVLDVEAEYGFQINPMTGESYADEKLRQARDRAWQRMARAGIQSRNIQRITERNLRSKRNLRELLDLADKARNEAGVERVRLAQIASTSDESPGNRTDEHRTELQPIDHVTPLGERGPPPVREIASDRGHGLSAALGKVPAMAGIEIVPTGHTFGGER